MLFCGRDHELNQLVERWKLASDVNNPRPQVVVIKAERGVGKTRLALEFNRWLSANNNKDGYWPDGATILGRNIDVNPNPELCNYRKPIPYLWWGLRGSDTKIENGLAGAAVSNYDQFVAPHLVALGVRAKMLSSGRAIMDTWGNVAKGELASWSGYDTVMSIGEGLVKTVAIVRGGYKESGNSAAREAGVKQQQSRLDILMEDLERIFNPQSLTYAKTPGVILIDDAQFATSDVSLAKFSERLMHTAVSQGWPLMVVVTHWRRELAADIKTANSFAGVLRHAREAVRDDAGPVAGLPGGYLSSKNFLEIDLTAVPDLSEALGEALPGLTSDQSKKLLEHAGGNPRHLEQIISFLNENEGLFEDFDTSKALTNEGLIEALTETHDLFTVVLRRLRDAPEEVQEAICIASIQGISFVSDVVDDMMQSLLKRGSLDALSKATNPYSMISKSQADEVAEFAERLFLQVADRRRKSLKSVADTNALTAALKSALRARLLDSSYRETADRQALAITYNLAAKTFVDGNEEIVLALNALASLASMEASHYAQESALSAANQFYKLFINNTNPTNGITVPNVVRVANILLHDGRMDAAFQVLSHLTKYAKQRYETNPSPKRSYEFAGALHGLATVAYTKGKFKTAIKSIEWSLKIYRTVKHTDFTRAILRGQIEALHFAYQAYMANGSHSNANTAISELFIVLERAQDFLPIEELQTASSAAYEAMGDYYDCMNDISARNDAWRKAAQSTQEIFDSNPSFINKINLIASLQREARSLLEAESNLEAEKVSKECVNICRELNDIIITTDLRVSLATSLTLLGEVLDKKGDKTLARENMEEASQIYRELSQSVSLDHTLKMLAASLRRIADMSQRTGDMKTAQLDRESVVDVYRQLLKKDSPETFDKLCMQLEELAFVAIQNRDTEKFEESIQESISIRDEMATQFPSPHTWSALLNTIGRASNGYLEIGQAEKALLRAIEGQELSKKIGGKAVEDFLPEFEEICTRATSAL